MKQPGSGSLSDWPAGPCLTPIAPRSSSTPPAMRSGTSVRCQMSSGSQPHRPPRTDLDERTYSTGAASAEPGGHRTNQPGDLCQLGDQRTHCRPTPAEHLQNIFNKLGVSSRTAATAFALEHSLL